MRIPHSFFAAVCAFALATMITACTPQETEFQETPAAEEEIQIYDERPPTQPGVPPTQPGMQPGMQPTQPGMQPGTQPTQPGMQPGTTAPGAQPGTTQQRN